MSAPRYAIYLAPAPDTPLWHFGSRVLGYDAENGTETDDFSLPCLDAPDWRKSTARPRQYGFHATLKAPFRLAEDTTPEALMSALGQFAAARPAFDPGPWVVTSLPHGDGGFVALVPQGLLQPLVALEAETVAAFNRFGAPLNDAERAARRPDQLSPRQRDYLERWGYPHVLEEFRPHMTLSGFMADPHDAADQLADELANRIGTAHFWIDALVLFTQESPEHRFRIVQRFALGAAPPTGQRAG